MSATTVRPLPPRRWKIRSLLDNPVLRKELRGRMRGPRAFIVLTFHVLFMSGAMLLIYGLYSGSASTPYTQNDRTVLGKTLFLGIGLIELIMASVIAPSLTASSITGERERQTFDLLRTTLVPAWKVVWGKLSVALLYVGMLLVTAWPVQTLAFLFGGIALEEIWISSAILIASAFLFGAVGIFFSAVLRRTLGATVLSYASMLGLGGLPVGIIFLLLRLSPNFGQYPLATQVLLNYLLLIVVSLSPYSAAFMTELLLTEQHTVFYFMTPLNYNGQTLTIPILSPWWPYTLFCFTLGLVLMAISVQAVQRQER